MVSTKQQKVLLYVDDILVTLTNPIESLVALPECITELGLKSGYIVYFDKSEVRILDNGGSIDPVNVKPFCRAPSGFNYLEVKISPKIS